MQEVCGVLSRGRSPSQHRGFGPAFTPSFSVLPALNVGDLDADIETASPVLGFFLIPGGLLLVPKVPNPAIRTSSLSNGFQY